MVCNRYFEKKSGGKLVGPLPIEKDTMSQPVLDVTITKDPSNISDISERLQKICMEAGMNKRTAVHAALAVEEIAVYASNRKSQSSHMDILVRIADGNVEIDFRSLGEAFDPLSDDSEDIAENVRLLRSIATSIDNEYMLGMNSTRLIINPHQE